MSNANLKVGDRVRLAEDARWPKNNCNPRGVWGTITRTGRAGMCIGVRWDNNTNNAYNNEDCDLLRQKDLSFKTRTEARAACTEGFVVVDAGADAEYRWNLTVKEI